jgi:hypothetical protein
MYRFGYKKTMDKGGWFKFKIGCSMAGVYSYTIYQRFENKGILGVVNLMENG